MSNLSIRDFSGASLVALPRSAPLESPAIQQAAVAPLVNPQSAVASSPDTASAQGRDPRERTAASQSPIGRSAETSTGKGQKPLSETVNYLNQFLRRCDTALEFRIDDQHGKMVVRIVDRQTEEVVRQIPSEKALAFAQFFEEMEKDQQHLTEAPQGVAAPANQRLKVEGLLLDTQA